MNNDHKTTEPKTILLDNPDPLFEAVREMTPGEWLDVIVEDADRDGFILASRIYKWRKTGKIPFENKYSRRKLSQSVIRIILL